MKMFGPRLVNSRTTLGLLLRDARKIRQMSQEELARQVGLTQPAISAVERGVRDLRFDTLLAILAAMRIELVLQARESQDPLSMWEG